MSIVSGNSNLGTSNVLNLSPIPYIKIKSAIAGRSIKATQREVLHPAIAEYIKM
jgi:hypothetical protein